MQEEQDLALAEARDLTRLSAQWLQLLGFRTHPAATAFSPSLSLYHDMLAPRATDASRVAACRALQPHVLCQVQAAQLQGKAAYARIRPTDPYGLEWRTTRDGAALAMIARLLAEAIGLFHEAGIEVTE
ncbi:MAG: hypothetical protein ACP5EN_13440 [Rhodovulum sp.]